IKQILALTLAVLLACQGNIVALADVQAPAVSEQITSVEKKTTPTETPKKAATKAAEKTPAEEPEKTPTETPKTTVTETPETTVTKTPEKTPTEAPKETPTKAAEKTPAEAPETTSAEPSEETPEKAPADPVETVQQASDVALLAVGPHVCDGVTFDKELTVGGELAAAGNYYLTGDLFIESTIVIRDEEANICLNGHTITMNAAGNVFTVRGSGKLTLYDCKGEGKVTHAPGINGIGVDVLSAGSTFIMNGGNIVGNKYPLDGGGINNKGTVEIHGGTIAGNSATGSNGKGGGIYSNSKLTIDGGEIMNNTAQSLTGGGGIYSSGKLTITNGSIHDNTAPGYGGGIIDNGGTTTISGGTISGNKSTNQSCGGGGICIVGTLTISGGKIENNTAAGSGGGIYVYRGGTATITGGEITGNTATKTAGGIYNEGTLTLNGAKIESNTAGGTGGGVWTKGTVTLRGNNDIWFNTNGKDYADNIYIPTGSYLTVSESVTGHLCVNTQVDPTSDQPVEFAKPGTGYTITDTDVSAFKSSTDGFVVKKNSAGNLELAVPAPALTAADFTYTAPSDLYYTGTAKAATVTPEQSATDAGVGDLTITYYDVDGKAVTPTKEGTYTVKVTDSNSIVTDLEMGSFTITRIFSASGASVSSRLGENDWYIGNVTITPPSGWKISTTDTADTKAWLDKLTQTADVESTTVSYYLKDAQGHITESKTTGTIKKDATPPDISKAEATEIKDTTAKIVISAYDATSGIASYGYAIKDSTMTGTKDDSSGMQSFTLTGLTANTAYTATVSVTDKAGNKQTRDVTFTTTKTLITTAAVTITAPVKGATPDTTATVAADAPYTAGAVTWAPEATKFMGSQAYRATVYLTPAAGYEFNDSTTATIPGVDGGTYAYLQDNGTLQVFGDFPKTAASVLDKIDVYDYKKTTYEAMDKFDPTGLQLLLTNDDGSTSIVAYGDDTKGDFTFSPETMTMDTDKVTITYSEKTTTLNVTVTKKEVTAPTIAAKDYTGSTLTADVNDTADYTVTANAGGTDAGDYDVVLTLKDPANYQWPGSTSATKTLTFTINKVAQKPLAITGQPNATPTYGDSFTLGTTGGSGINPVTWAVTKGLATVGADGKVTVTGVGTVTITATRKADNNHTADVSDSYTVTVAKADLTITANDQTLTYGDTFKGNGVTYSGFVNGDTEAKLSGTLGYTTTYNTQSTVGSTQTLTPKGLTSSNYKITFAAGNLTVEQRVATLTWTGADERAYDGKASNVTATAGNLVNNETLTVTVTGGTETNVGSHTATATKLTGTTAANYKLPTTATKDYKIVQSATTLTATADKASYTYGDTIKVTANITPSGTAAATKALTVPTANQIALYYGTTQISDPVTAGADGKVTLTYATTEKTVPAGKQNLTVKYTGNDNMADATADVSVTIAKKEVTAPTIAAADYTGKTQTATVAANELYKVTKNAGGTDVGDYDVVLTLTDAKNYTWPKSDNAALTLKFTINKVAQAGLTIKDQPTTVTYGDAAFTLKTEGGSGTGAVTWSAEGKATVDKVGKVTITGAGEAIITATKAADGNHTEAVTATYKVTVAKKALTVTAKDHTITYGDKPAGNGVDYDGFAKGDDAGKLSGTLAYDHTYQQYGDVGANYKITPKGLTSDNYNITFKAGTLTVEQLEATFTWNNVKE
ncbi:MAG: MBG domain-containing protein, partial [Oscillospiraceae bacterium]|nr:MBG domain-containing protein [Oscillospiraceae bacterium]